MPAWFRSLLLLAAVATSTTALADGFSNSATAAAGAENRTRLSCSIKGCTKVPCGVADPVNTRDGSFYLMFTDLSLGTLMPIDIVRRYDSRSEFDSALGYGWAFDHERRLFEYPDGSVVVRSGCGRRDRFVLTANAFVTPEGGPEGTLKKNTNGTYTFTFASGDFDTFNANGWLTQRVDARGNRHEYLYDSRGKLPLIGSSPNAVDPTKPMVVAYMPRLTTIRERGADNVLTGYSVSFTYSADSGRVTKVTGSDGRVVNYTHDGSGANTKGNLVGVAGLTDLAQTFAYADPNDLHNITTFADGTGAQAVVNTYDAQDRVTQQVDGNSTFAFGYPTSSSSQITQTVRNAAGSVIQTRVSKYEYNAVGYLVKHTDPFGHELRYQYDGNNEISRVEWWTNTSGTLTLLKAVDTTYTARAQKLTEAVTLDTGEKITTTWAYDGAWIKSLETVSTASPQRFRTEYTFLRNSANQPRAIASVRARKDDGTFAVSTYTYCTAAEAAAVGTLCPDISLVKSIDGPRTDVADTASFTYYGATDTTGCATATGNCWRRGDLKTTTNALGQTVTVLRYDTTGRPVRVQDANGVRAEMVYHPRGWLQQSIVRGLDDAVTTDDAITQYEVDARGNLTKLTTPDGIALTMVYDRLTQLTGSTTAQKTVMTYDAAGRVTKTVDPNLVEVVQSYDDLDRLIQSVADAKSGGLQTLTQYTYDAVGNLRTVVDPKGLTTRYTYDAFGRLTKLESPDTGISTYTFDDAGNRLTKTDARNKTSTYTYDALNRLLTVTQPTAAENVSFTYDTPSLVCAVGETFTVGRLTRMVDESGSTDYCYDRFGNLVRKVQTTAGRAYTVRYAYTLGNELRSITYPDGMVVDYLRDAQSRIREVGVQIGAAARQILLNNATYLPAGPSTGWTYGNGRTLVRSFDKDYRALTIKGNATGSLDLGFRYDNAGYLKEVTNAALATTPQFKLTYDALGRITQRTTSANAVLEAYTVDGTGNRSSQTTGTSPATPYTYAANSHRLTQIGSVGRTYDAAGNTTSVGGTQREYAYNDAGRLKEAKQDGAITGSYRYNAKGEQVQRTAGGTTTVFVYDEAGSLLGQYNNATGASIQSYAWMGGIPVGAISGTTLHYVEADHLGTPRAVVNATSQKAIWSWSLNSEAFGNTAPNTDPDADGAAYVFDLRFPGQRHDQASGLSYNYFRDYEAATGRYAQSDPIGLAGGISTYGYVAGNPSDRRSNPAAGDCWRRLAGRRNWADDLRHLRHLSDSHRSLQKLCAKSCSRWIAGCWPDPSRRRLRDDRQRRYEAG